MTIKKDLKKWDDRIDRAKRIGDLSSKPSLNTDNQTISVFKQNREWLIRMMKEKRNHVAMKIGRK